MKSILIALLALQLFSGVSQAQATNVPYGNNPAVGKYYDIHGFKMYCEIYGSGRPLLLIHGNGGSISAFQHNLPYFAARYKVIAADSRAQGKSQDAGNPLTFEMMADDDAALLDTLKIDSAYVIGWSDGGINALLFASAFAPGLWDGWRKYYEANKNQVWQTEKEKNDWKLFLLDWNQPNIPLTALHSIHCPSLIICGDHDLISIEHTVQIYQNIPQAALWVVPFSGHATLVEHADDFNRTVDDFFSKSSPSLK